MGFSRVYLCFEVNKTGVCGRFDTGMRGSLLPSESVGGAKTRTAHHFMYSYSSSQGCAGSISLLELPVG